MPNRANKNKKARERAKEKRKMKVAEEAIFFPGSTNMNTEDAKDVPENAGEEVDGSDVSRDESEGGKNDGDADEETRNLALDPQVPDPPAPDTAEVPASEFPVSDTLGRPSTLAAWMGDPKTLAMYFADMLAGLDNLTVLLQVQGHMELAIWVKEAATQFDEKFTKETKTDLMMQRYTFKEAMWEKVGAKFGLSLGFMRKIYGDFLRPLGQDSNRSAMARAERMAVAGLGAGPECTGEVGVENEGAELEDVKQLSTEQKGFEVEREIVEQEGKRDVKVDDGRKETQKHSSGKEKDWKKEAEALLAEDEAGKEELWM